MCSRPAPHIYDQSTGLPIDYSELHAQLVGRAQFETDGAEANTRLISSCIHRCEQRNVIVYTDVMIVVGDTVEAICTFISEKLPACIKAG
jgi:hypothetical protein